MPRARGDAVRARRELTLPLWPHQVDELTHQIMQAEHELESMQESHSQQVLVMRCPPCAPYPPSAPILVCAVCGLAMGYDGRIVVPRELSISLHPTQLQAVGLRDKDLEDLQQSPEWIVLQQRLKEIRSPLAPRH